MGAIFILLFYTRLVRPLVNWMTTSVEVVDSAPETLTIEEEEEEERKRLAELAPTDSQVKELVNDFVKNDPMFSASIVRKWLRERKTAEE